ncbi:MAG: energy-coupling factor transporter ATPase [Erysipelotrichaceae bacterium]|nr:energy-coupling factor transporter ATPase [Erysipelotrichaceae bacterium]
MPIKIKDLSYVYSTDTLNKTAALNDISLDFAEGKIYAVIGETGSGKSTLIQHLNALLLPQIGSVEVDGQMVVANKKNKKLKALRKKVGLVFQFSEYQLFEENILKDVAFGPKNFGHSEAESIFLAKKALKLVGIDEELFERSPFELSGGQKRKVAIAGILALEPKYIVLDEPTSGLDPQSAKELMELFVNINKSHQTTIIIVTHDYEVVFNYADEVILLDHGNLIIKSDIKAFFTNQALIEKYQLAKPNILKLVDQLRAKGFEIKDYYDNLAELIVDIKRWIK